MFSCINVHQVPREKGCLKPRMAALVVIQGHLISQLYMDEMLRSVVLPLLCETQ